MKLRLMLLVVSINLALAAGYCLTPVMGADEKPESPPKILPLSEEIKFLEGSLSINSSQEGSAEQRVAALENRLLGSTQSGSLIARVEHLKQVNEARQVKGSAEPEAKSHLGGDNFKACDPLIGRALKKLPLANETSVNFVRMSPPSNKPETSGDYYGEIMAATKNKVMRFKQMPVRVYITPGPQRLLTRACIHGFEIWEERTDGIVRFVQVDDASRARIKVVWMHLGGSGNRGGCNVGARTISQWGGDTASSSGPTAGGIPLSLLGNSAKSAAPPQVIEVNLDFIFAKPEDVRMLLLQNLIAHELGHALGILSHSPEKSDLMYAITDEHSRLSQRDINTLKKLYESKVDVAL
jgi:hypothetical protein